MPLTDVAAMNTSLDNDYDGVDVTVALIVGTPGIDAVELDSTSCPGYARFASPAADRVAAADGRKRICEATYDATDLWAAEATGFQIYVGSVAWDWAPLAEPLEVSGAGPVSVLVDVFYDDSVPTD